MQVGYNPVAAWEALVATRPQFGCAGTARHGRFDLDDSTRLVHPAQVGLAPLARRLLRSITGISLPTRVYRLDHKINKLCYIKPWAPAIVV